MSEIKTPLVRHYWLMLSLSVQGMGTHVPHMKSSRDPLREIL